VTEIAATELAQATSPVSEATLSPAQPSNLDPLPANDTPGADANTGHATEAAHSTETAQDASAAELARQAALFNQFCNADPAPGATPLGFVPLDQGLHFVDPHVVAQDSAYQALQAA
jgi:hypothetical protein